MYARLTCLLVVLGYSVGGHAQHPTPKPNFDTVLVCAPALLHAARPWIEYRAKQGHQIALVSGDGSRSQIIDAIRSVASECDLKFVVVMGDAPSGTKQDIHVETEQVSARVILKWNADPTFASDGSYADLDDDGSPDVASGRICADSADELGHIIQKTIAYEQNRDFSQWRRRVNFVAGVGGFGILADKVIETAAKKFITDGIPSAYNTSMTQASWRSPYSPDPRLFRQQTIETLNQGCLAWVYLGHGQEQGLDYYRYPGGGLPIFMGENVPQVNVRMGSPIAVFLSCYTGAFASPQDCLAEELLANGRGPVAVISGSNVTMPYAMTVMANAMLHELFIERRETIGDVLLHAKRELAKPTPDQPEGMIDQLAKVISPHPELLDEERLEHVRLFHLFGDPLLRIQHPKQVSLQIAAEAIAGSTIQILGHSELAGPATLELVCRRDRLTFRADARPRFEKTDKWLRQLQDTYIKANDTRWTSVQIEVPAGDFSTTLTVPEHAHGVGHVRLFVEGEQEFALGSADIYLRAKPAPAQP